jgi:copper chaperone NosL
MSTKARLLFLVGVLLIGLASLVPIWRIEIWAPQYPEGLMIQIKTDGMQGNVSQINILNHYIGMKKIVPRDIPELKIIPRVLDVLLVSGILIGLFSRIVLARIWLGGFLCSLGIGLFDFYLWGYDYGHNLDPDAPIRIPGLSYQPPLIGHKTLLNIQSYSLPDWGGYILLFALALLLTSVSWDKLAQLLKIDEKKSPAPPSSRFGGVARRIGAVSAALLVNSCTAKPEPFHVGADHCEACRMTIVDPRFGGEVITDKGRIYKFDSLNCLLGYLREHRSGIKQVLVSDFAHPGELIDAEKAYFAKSASNQGPMGSSIVASQLQKDGVSIKWTELVASSQK